MNCVKATFARVITAKSKNRTASTAIVASRSHQRSTVIAAMVIASLILWGADGAGRNCWGQRLSALPQPGDPIIGTFTSEATDGLKLVLTAGPNLTVAMKPARQTTAQYWTIAPVGRDTVRLQLFEDGRLWSLSVDPDTGAVGFERSAQKVEQLWRITPSLAIKDAVRLESAAFRGNYLSGSVNSRVTIGPPSPDPEQNWYFDTAPPPPSVTIPVQEMSQVTQQPNAPLEPVRTRLVNSHRNAVLVRVTDLRTLQAVDITIPAGKSRDVTLERDSGATFVESYQVVGPLGNVFTQRYVTSLPPAPLYDITVYEKFLQSIAIDRTGKSPNKIEDINYQPKSVGLFLIPPGSQFTGGEIDVYQSAKKANNPGAARRIDPEIFGRDTNTDPLEQALRELRDR